jgi:hypothetical protein
LRHPRRIDEGKLIHFSCCTNVGCFGCSKENLNSVLDKYCLGTSAFFKTLKSLIWTFFIIVLLNLVVYLIYSNNILQGNIKSISDFLFKTTIGNISLSKNIFKKRINHLTKLKYLDLSNCIKISRQKLETSQFVKVNFDCKNLKYSGINQFGLSENKADNLLNESKCNEFLTSLDLITNQECRLDYYLNQKIGKKCEGVGLCEEYLNSEEIFSNCPLIKNNDNIFLSYRCNDKTLSLFNFTFDRSILSYLIVGIDALSVIILLITVIILRTDYNRLEKTFKEKNKVINQFTINIKNRNIGFNKINKEINSLLSHLDKIIKKNINYENNILRKVSISKSTNLENRINLLKTIRSERDDLKEDNDSSTFDFSIENKFPTYIYEVNYPYLAEEKLRLILKKEDLIKEFIHYKGKLKKLEKINKIGYKKIENKKKKEKKEENEELNNNQYDFNDFNIDDINLDNFDDFFNSEKDNKNENYNENIINPSENEIIKPKEKPKIPKKNKIEYIKIIYDLRKTKSEITEIIKKIKNLSDRSDEKINDIFVTFLEPRYASFIYKSYNKSRLSRCWTIFCCNYKSIKHLYYKGSWLKIDHNPDNPSNIKWENMLISSRSRLCSKIISLIFSIILIFFGIGIVISLKIYMEIVNEEFDSSINCNFITYDINSVIKEYNDPLKIKRNKILNYCFCSDMFYKKGLTETLNYKFPSTNIIPCKDWLTAFVKNNLITLIITIGIPISNAILNFFLTLLTSFEKNKNLSSDQTSNMNKIFFSQFINTGLIILIININVREVKRWSNNFPILTGDYDDISISWFRNVGTTIYLALIFTIVAPIFEGFLEYLFICIKRYWDSRNMKGIGSKISNQISFNRLYVGPELKVDKRYAEVLLSIF